MQAHTTNATQAKDRHYMQLSNSLARLSQAVGHTADLCELLKSNLDAMRTLASSHAAQYVSCIVELDTSCSLGHVRSLTMYHRFMTVAAELNAEDAASEKST
ncbi:uncharacterized protein C8Q71DRAFT_745860 [Rhodofomes roseus]|uniref:Phasin domain-containing protein n=1 Tax=Rhodofomes roseus TaxID=34475 RepID=A0ABQ8KPG5_9APHY|nr:uncharacterized protein C8Q71DRAFT_745860 [Rhodofomes roseus]KAH9840114.1 hypothetical protein C8Q71DRAFT_745860 [Rhodofomes roseus]